MEHNISFFLFYMDKNNGGHGYLLSITERKRPWEMLKFKKILFIIFINTDTATIL
jgi:hypothetical protein